MLPWADSFLLHPKPSQKGLFICYTWKDIHPPLK